MRFTDSAPLHVESPIGEQADNRAFFEALGKRLSPDALSCSVLLVGSSDARSRVLRRAQASLRFDRGASAWSHAALITRAGKGGKATGVEVSLMPRDPAAQLPENNGVTSFSVRDYADAEQHPNVAVLAFSDDPDAGARQPHGSAKAAKKAMLRAVEQPNRDRMRYPLWEQLGPWAAFSYNPEGTGNPLFNGTPMPSASLCELAFEAAGVDIYPGATDDRACPEHLWATFKRWGSRLASAAGWRVHLFSIIRDRGR